MDQEWIETNSPGCFPVNEWLVIKGRFPNDVSYEVSILKLGTDPDEYLPGSDWMRWCSCSIESCVEHAEKFRILSKHENVPPHIFKVPHVHENDKTDFHLL